MLINRYLCHTVAMPSKNVVKQYDVPAYYHVYNRGAWQQPIFRDDRDRQKFISLLARHLDITNTDKRSDGLEYEKYDVELVAYCLMGNHFHLLLHQEDDVVAITQLMRSVSTAYTMYFNRRHKHSGHLFQGIFKAVRIDDDDYLLHITRYIHMNPQQHLDYEWSSVGAYLGGYTPNWLHPERVNDMSADEYRDFLDSYQDRRDELANIKEELGL